MNRKYAIAGFQLILILALGFLIVWLTSLFTNKVNPEQNIKFVVLPKPTCPETYSGYSGLIGKGQVVYVVKNLRTHVAGGQFVNQKTINVSRSGSGSEVACGYLYIDVSVGNKPLLQPYESIYIDPDDFGGHIDTGNAISARNENGGSQFLFDLTKMAYTEGAKLTYSQGSAVSFSQAKSSQFIRTADWAALFNVSNIVNFRIALSTTNTRGTIREIAIAYKCWNPQSGQETNDCKLSVD